MNKLLQKFTRKYIKHHIKKCTPGQIHKFKRLYSASDLGLDINIIIDNIDEQKLDHAMFLVMKTNDTNKKLNGVNDE